MKASRRSAAAAFLLGLAACVATAPDASRGAQRAVLISLDGLGGERLAGLAREGRLTGGGFSAFFERGLVAGRAVTVTPSQTSVAHVAAITGTLPARSGVVANVLHPARSPFGSTVRGFDQEIETETLWEAALRQGKRVGILTYPGADDSSASRRGSFGLLYPQRPLVPSRFVSLGPGEWSRETDPGRRAEPARLARIPVGEGPLRAEITLRVLDGRDETLEVATGSDAALTVRAGEWFPVRTSAARAADRAGAWCRLVRFDPQLARTVVYVGQLFGIAGYPEEFRDRVAAAAGFWPGQADERLLAGDPHAGVSPDPDGFVVQSERLSRYLTDVLLWSLGHESWDLLITYQPGVDEIEHEFEPADPREPERASSTDRAARRVARAVQNADVELARVVSRMDPRSSLFVFSDHGMAHAERAFDLWRFLSRAGWEVLGASSARPGAPRVQVCAGSGLAHLYVDRALPPADREREISSLLASLRSLAAREPGLVEELRRREELGPLGLDHPNSGDVVVLLVPGAVFQKGDPSSAGLFDPPRTPGAHGYRATHPWLDASFLALGPGIAPARPPVVALTDVASTVARALGIDPPRGAGRR